MRGLTIFVVQLAVILYAGTFVLAFVAGVLLGLTGK